MKNELRLFVLMAFALATIASCRNNPSKYIAVKQQDWGTVAGKAISLFTLTNKYGMQVKISNYGGTVTSWLAPDKNGTMANIVLGFDSLTGYLQKPPYFGALIGRYGNRIAHAAFTLDAAKYQLAANDGTNHLHGGVKGFDKVVWDAAIVSDTVPALLLTYLSKDGEEGYPGNLKVSVRYQLTNNNELTIEYNAQTDKPTPVNLTQHNYYNLSGSHTNTILQHLLQINAAHYTPVDSTLIPTGEIKAVKGTPFDFMEPTAIGKRIDSVKGGYDHNWVLDNVNGSLQLVAVLQDTASGRRLQVFTTEPGLQFYSGNFLDGTLKDEKGIPFKKYTGLCLETQHFPNAPNQPAFPNTILRPGQQYQSITKYAFSVK